MDESSQLQQQQHDASNDSVVGPSSRSVADAQRKREEAVVQAIASLQKASETVFKYCTNEDFRQTTMRVLGVQDWTRVPDAAHSCWAQVAKKFHNVDISRRNEVVTVPVAPDFENPLVVSEALGAPEIVELDKDDDFDRLAAFAELMESEP